MLEAIVDLVWLLALLALLVVSYWNRGDDDGDPVEAAHQAYAEGEIDEAELERRIEIAIDEDAQQLRETVEQVAGIGPAHSLTLAQEFDSLDELRRADRADLLNVNGIGSAKADALKRYLDDSN